MKTKITILGAGAWGQAITSLLCEINKLTNNYNITLWCHETKIITNLANLPGTTNSQNLEYFGLEVTQDLTSALENCDFLFVAIPVKYLREILTQVKNILGPIETNSLATQPQIILLSKGIEQASLLFSSEITQEILGIETQVAVLSGPSFAHDLIAKQPTAVVVASEKLALAQTVKNIFTPRIDLTNSSARNNLYFQVQISQDILGVQICAAYKNILALGAGILSGAGYHDNTRAYFLTMGLQELNLLVYTHTDPQNNYQHPHPLSQIETSRATSTVYGLAGVGDLILTACSQKSRNFQVGAKLGTGIKLTEIISNPELANCEALNTVQSINLLAQKLNLNLPIAQAIYQVVYAGAPVDQILMALK